MCSGMLVKRPNAISTRAQALQSSLLRHGVPCVGEVAAGFASLPAEGPTALVLKHTCPRKAASMTCRGVGLGVSILHHCWGCVAY